MKQRIGIIADDLTGANDSGVQLTEKGVNTSVLFDVPGNLNNLDSGVVIDTNSRALSKEQAASVTMQAGRFLKEAGYPTIYKKMDSTLRGHIGTELQALYEVFKPEFVFIAPAFPALGRTTKGGIHYVNGVRISETEISNDPKHPVTEAFIPAIFEKEIGQKIGLVTLKDFDMENFQEKISSFRKDDVSYIICDAETQNDLKVAARNMAAISENVIWAGSAGLAEVLPDVLGLSQDTASRSFAKSNKVMTVCGSLSQINKSQVEYALKQPNVTGVEIDTSKIFTKEWNHAGNGYVQEILEGLDKGDDIVLYVPSNQEVREKIKQIGSDMKLSSNEIGERISGAIGEVAASVMERNKELKGLVLTGGDTAKDTSRNLGGIGFQLIKQLEAGIPLGTLIGTNREYTIVTKAGAFGGENSIYHAMLELKEGQNYE
ncbi:four-carbon acid sugar kinase family protein [Virgibacillus oceani]|uniref:Membrane protein n=1 Tax=Virgibacillus oceani TaxID=1479511 RepID=A0A917M7M5_9BACI|nr:four-carbon acid sugar kinase family protein [Virgibacillus oceani]GGG82657.1 membrane protein [Virgibacillus oceani]